MHVVNKNGERQNRANGVLQDGDHIHVLRVHDHGPAHPDLDKAIKAARIARDDFNPANHRPGFANMADAKSADARSKAIDARNAKLGDRWKSPPNVLADQVVKQQDVAPVKTPEGMHPAEAKDLRLEQAWMRP